MEDHRFLARAGDDAVVFQISEDLAVVQTVDYITPVVNDPYAFGTVAAANSLSDIYAMGASPAFALNLVGFPLKSLPLSHLGQILRGGADKAAEAGICIAGGHSVDDPAPKYGLAVTGFVHPSQVVTKRGARPGDVLILTKPLGTGVVTTAIDRYRGDAALEYSVYRAMASLNRGAAEAMVRVGASACTDVSGFGLLGHLHEMVTASGGAARVSLEKVPVMPEAWELATDGNVSRGTLNNQRYLEGVVEWAPGVPPAGRILLCDAQTSGGLLIALPAEKKDMLLAALQEANTLVAAEIGEILEGPPGRLLVTE